MDTGIVVHFFTALLLCFLHRIILARLSTTCGFLSQYLSHRAESMINKGVRKSGGRMKMMVPDLPFFPA